MIVFVVGPIVLVALAVLAWRISTRRSSDARLAEIARVGMSRDRFPSCYVGPDTAFGLRSGTVCRIRSHKAGNVIDVVTPDGRAWNVPGRHVARRPGRDAPPARVPRPGRRARRRAA